MSKNIYLISCDLYGEKMYKIGYTKRDVEQRVLEMRTGNPGDFKIISTFNSDWGSKIEASLKRNYSDYNIGGEWFILPEDEIVNFIENCSKLHNNFELLSKNNTFIIDKGWI